MARLDPLPPEHSPELKDQFASFLKSLGFVPNSVLTMQRDPKLVQAFVTLQGAIWGPDSKVDLDPNWNTTEWGVFGDAGGGEAYFVTANTLEAQTALTGTSSAAPKCVKVGFTGETNNLKPASAPALGTESLPTMACRQTDGSAGTASCAVKEYHAGVSPWSPAAHSCAG